MRHLGMPDLDGDRRQSFPNVADPVVTAQRGKGLADRFVEPLGRHVECVRGLVRIMDNVGRQALRATTEAVIPSHGSGRIALTQSANDG